MEQGLHSPDISRRTGRREQRMRRLLTLGKVLDGVQVGIQACQRVVVMASCSQQRCELGRCAEVRRGGAAPGASRQGCWEAPSRGFPSTLQGRTQHPRQRSRCLPPRGLGPGDVGNLVRVGRGEVVGACWEGDYRGRRLWWQRQSESGLRERLSV